MKKVMEIMFLKQDSHKKQVLKKCIYKLIDPLTKNQEKYAITN